MSSGVDPFTLLASFLRVAEAGSLSAAAAQLGVSQPTASRRLRALEDRLGVRLIDRTTHALQLTDAGRRHLAEARDLLERWQALSTAVRGAHDAPEGLLRVVVPHAFGQERLLSAAAELLRRHPAVRLEWLLSDGPVRFVEDGVDCVIRVGQPVGDALVTRKLFEVQRVVVAAPSLVPAAAAPTRPAALASFPWLALGPYYRNSVRLLGERGATATVRVQPRFVTDSLFALRRAACEGLGLALASEWIVADDLAAGRLVRIVPRWRGQSLPVYVGYPPARYQPARLRAFLQVLRDAFARPPSGPA